MARPVGERLLESPSRSPSPAPRAAIARMDVPVRIGAPRKSSSSSSASSAPSVSGRAVAPAPRGSSQKGIVARAIAYISKKTQRRPVGKVAGDRLLESPSRSSSAASSRSGIVAPGPIIILPPVVSRPASSASSRKSSSSAASSRSGIVAPGAIKILPPIVSRPASSASSRSSRSSDDSHKPAPKISFHIKPLPGPKGAVAMGGPKSPKPIKILRPVVTPPASPKGKGWDAPLPAWLGHVTPPPVVKKGIRGTPFPASPKKVMSPVATEDWKPTSFFDSVKGKPVMVSDLGWDDAPKGSSAKKLSASKSMKAKGALSTGKAISGLLDLKAIGTEEEKVARKKADKLKIHHMLIHQGKIKEANAYLIKHNLKPSMDAIDDIIGHVSVVMDKSGTPHLVSPKTKSSMDYLKSPKTKNSMDYLKSPKTKNSMDYLASPLSVVELTPSIGDSPLSVVELTPSASPSSHSNYKHDKSFGKLADALAAAAAESPKSSRSSRSGRGIRSRSGSRSSTKSSSSMDYLKNIHKKVVNPGVSPTFAKHDSKKGDWV